MGKGAVVRHRRGLFERAAFLKIGRDAVARIAELGGDAGRARAPADHRIGDCQREQRAREEIVR